MTGSPDPVISAALEQDQGLTFAAGEPDPVDLLTVGLAGAGTDLGSSLSPSPRVGRRLAMQVPALRRAVDLVGTLGTLPLVTVKPDLSVDRLSWLMQPEADVPRSVTMSRTLADLALDGIAWWKVVAFDWRGFPARVVRLDPRSVDVLPDWRVRVTLDGHRGTSYEYPQDRELIRFEMPGPGWLVEGARAIRTCLLLDAAAQRYADEPTMAGYFSPAEGVDPGTDDEIIAMLDAYKLARQQRVTGYVPGALKYNTVQGFSPDDLQLADARQHAVLEISRLTGIDAEELGVSTTSRTYANSFDRRKNFLDFTLGQFRAVLEDRLSMGDITPRGTLTRFDFDAFLSTDAKSRWEAAKVGLEVGAITREEVRAGENRPALTEPEETSPMPNVLPAAPVVEQVDTDVVTASFDQDETTTMDASAPVGTVFAVDVEKRTIRGLAVPFGVEGIKGGRRFVFSKGTVRAPEPSRVKLWVGHDKTTAVGVAFELAETDEGLEAAFRVARGAEGDKALSMAEDGVWDGLSIGPSEGAKYRTRDGVFHAVDVPIHEISLTPAPVFGGARVRSVAFDAQEGTQMPPETETQTAETQVPEVNFDAITEAITAGFANLTNPQSGPEAVSAGRPALEINEPTPYRFDGLAGSHGFVEDLRSANFGDTEARSRVDQFVEEAFAVTTANVGSLNPTENRPDLFVPNLTFTRPLWESVTTGTVNDRTPFSIPKFASATGLVAAHTEGVEPTPGAAATTAQTVTPQPMSGKVEINREVLDQGGSPQADAIVWGEMQNAYFEAIEQRIATTLAAVPTATLSLAGATGSDLVDAFTNYYAGLQFVRGGNRFTGLVLDGLVFPSLISAKDDGGRALLPVLGPANAQGAVGGGFDRVAIGNQTGRAAWALGATAGSKSYSFVPSSVWAWASAPQRFTFEYQVKSVDLAIWGYSASAVLRDSDVKPITAA